jgi:tetratricopeptide (TPR) repeat protein
MIWYRATPARTVALVVLALGALLAITTTLARYYEGVRLLRAGSHLERGRMLVRVGELDRGLIELRAALALHRDDPETTLELATALLEADRPREAETYLDEAIERDPTSGPANLARARVARELDSRDTETFYQRAYFGSWGTEVTPRRLTVGFELVEYLLSSGDRERARGVLTQLAVDGARDTDVLLRVALLLVDAGAPGEAVPLLREVVARRPGDAPAWGALASAAFAIYEDQIAARAAAQAIDLDRGDKQSDRIAQLAQTAFAMDPRAGRLSTRERIRRARVVLVETVRAYDACVAKDMVTAPPDSARAEAAPLLADRPRADAELDDLLDVAARIWRERRERCPEVPPDLAPLARVFERLAAGATR